MGIYAWGMECVRVVRVHVHPVSLDWYGQLWVWQRTYQFGIHWWMMRVVRQGKRDAQGLDSAAEPAQQDWQAGGHRWNIAVFGDVSHFVILIFV